MSAEEKTTDTPVSTSAVSATLPKTEDADKSKSSTPISSQITAVAIPSIVNKVSVVDSITSSGAVTATTPSVETATTETNNDKMEIGAAEPISMKEDEKTGETVEQQSPTEDKSQQMETSVVSAEHDYSKSPVKTQPKSTEQDIEGEEGTGVEMTERSKPEEKITTESNTEQDSNTEKGIESIIQEDNSKEIESKEVENLVKITDQTMSQSSDQSTHETDGDTKKPAVTEQDGDKSKTVVDDSVPNPTAEANAQPTIVTSPETSIAVHKTQINAHNQEVIKQETDSTKIKEPFEAASTQSECVVSSDSTTKVIEQPATSGEKIDKMETDAAEPEKLKNNLEDEQNLPASAEQSISVSPTTSTTTAATTAQDTIVKTSSDETNATLSSPTTSVESSTTQVQGTTPPRKRPLLIKEQPLLLQDLVEKEKLEQERARYNNFNI